MGDATSPAFDPGALHAKRRLPLASGMPGTTLDLIRIPVRGIPASSFALKTQSAPHAHAHATAPSDLPRSAPFSSTHSPPAPTRRPFPAAPARWWTRPACTCTIA